MPDADRHEEFMRLFLANEARVFAYIRSLMVGADDAQDVLQDVAVLLWRKFDEFAPGTSFDRWALRTAYFRVLTHRRERQRDRLQFDDALFADLAAEAESAHEEAEAVEQALRFCLERLPEADRALVRERYAPGVTNRDVARASGRSESAVSRALSRVQAALLHCIEGRLRAQEGGAT
jgi:RNA polymerase sigma-70 factor, ECF subfamily